MSADEPAPPPLAWPKDSAYRELFDATSDAHLVHDPEGRILLVNAQTCELFGYTRQEALALTMGDLSARMPPFTRERALAYVERAMQEGECAFEWLAQRSAGGLFWTEVTLRRLELDGRAVVLASVRDIDARKHMEAALRSSEERFGTIFNATSTMLAFTERKHGRIVDVNDAWLEARGAKREEVIGKNGLELGLWAVVEDRTRIMAMLSRDGRVREVEADLNMGGRTLPARISAEHIEVHGEPFVLWELTDLSERKRAEREEELLRNQLLQAQKMESIGQLAGGIAHDFNNILSVILGFGDLVQSRLAAGSTEASFVGEMVRAGERASELTKQLLAFSRKQVMQPRVVDPVTVLRGMEPMLARLIGEDVIVQLALMDGTGAIRVDVSHLEQAIMNLVVNARDAMPDGGTLTLETANVDFDATMASKHADMRTGPHVMIAVSDTGAGMDVATRERAFEPFFTTKGPGKGTGLGLSTVYGIVKQSGGWVWLYSEEGKGTTFKLYFPRSIEPAQAAGDQPPPPVRPRAGTVVLLVEDEPQVRRLGAKILGDAGYTVLVAGDPREALDIAHGHVGDIHLLLTDVVMPHMSGRQLAEKVTAARPETRVIYVSGYTENTVVHRGEVDEGVNFLSKPITPNRLLAMVARVLDDPRPRTHGPR
jgi:PAS domain S-box-containing protein